MLERDEDCLEDIINSDRFLKENEKSFIKVKNNVRSGLSSSFVREKMGADMCILEDKDTGMKIQEMTDGQGVGVVLDTVGAVESQKLAFYSE